MECDLKSETALPAHVPPELVFDFDLFDIPGAQEDVQLAIRAFQQDCPDIFWTPRNGGHWVATRADDIALMQRDWEHFSNDEYLVPRKPAGSSKEIPLECDPPRHAELRRPLTAALLPREVAKLEDNIRTLAIELVENIQPRGACEFVEDIAQALPISIFLDMANLPREDRHGLRPLTHLVIHSPTQEGRAEGYERLREYLLPVISARRDSPGTDLISMVVNCQDGGERISEENAFIYAAVVLFGGLDSVASMLATITRFLIRNPAARREIIENLDDEEFMRSATEELLRRHGQATTARLVVEDIEHKGVHLKAGDMVCVLHPLAGLDERFIADPLTIDLRRSPVNTHSIFGSGPHICPGAVLARREVKIFLQEWLRRIPDFAFASGTTPKMTTGPVFSLSDMHLVWPVPA